MNLLTIFQIVREIMFEEQTVLLFGWTIQSHILSGKYFHHSLLQHFVEFLIQKLGTKFKKLAWIFG